jgi:hypothetical protein
MREKCPDLDAHGVDAQRQPCRFPARYGRGTVLERSIVDRPAGAGRDAGWLTDPASTCVTGRALDPVPSPTVSAARHIASPARNRVKTNGRARRQTTAFVHGLR